MAEGKRGCRGGKALARGGDWVEAWSMENSGAVTANTTGALRKKIGWCAIILGALGVHKFMLGYPRAGWIMLAIGVLGWFPFAIPTLVISAVGLIEGIIYLRKTDAEFESTYLRGRREWF